jgi:hypothetical protein
VYKSYTYEYITFNISQSLEVFFPQFLVVKNKNCRIATTQTNVLSISSQHVPAHVGHHWVSFEEIHRR